MNEQFIKDYFHSNKPATTDGGTYLTALKSRLDAVEEIKRIHEKEVAKCRRRTVVTFVCGMVAGAISVAFIILRPVSAPQFSTEILSSVCAFVYEWKMCFWAGIAVSALVLGLHKVRSIE